MYVFTVNVSIQTFKYFKRHCSVGNNILSWNMITSQRAKILIIKSGAYLRWWEGGFFFVSSRLKSKEEILIFFTFVLSLFRKCKLTSTSTTEFGVVQLSQFWNKDELYHKKNGSHRCIRFKITIFCFVLIFDSAARSPSAVSAVLALVQKFGWARDVKISQILNLWSKCVIFMAGLQNASRPQQIYNTKIEGDLQSFRKIITRTKYFVKTQQHNYVSHLSFRVESKTCKF